ncbi:alkaline-phosphatase-like protein [Aspergillus pseudotamarii]|uniref:Alkaline-phosphatase-like protein n=1 Tax=Aspergillus pseudotamarii TaxID=132259 RepID=A0A5N6TA35_ASPPS|nr:alkaline-phosphatase-like protein [Aspergillus pseudotamarii]KAE8143234.1 alkaline-phosphatase-like protein [Aspergillus pseudotamarii]
MPENPPDLHNLFIFMIHVVVHAVGLYFFTKGFLSSRRVLENSSTCTRPLLPAFPRYESSYLQSTQSGCWMPRSFDKAVILVIDALRYDFAVPHAPQSSGNDAYQPFHNALTILHEKATQEPQNAVLFPFIADPPTTTLQRLKGLMTGTLPTFIEAGSNFAGSALSEDNFVTQLQKAGKRLVHLGDDTWTKLFPNHFLPNLSRAYDSFLVADLHTVDQGVREHLIPLIKHRQDEWDVIFGHLLGVDHVGHRFGPAHPEMCNKLKEMNCVIGEIVNSIDENTLLVVLGDHGMDEHGNHGGETENEVQAALWMYTRRKHFGHLLVHPQEPASYLNKSAVYQIDFVSTLSLLLGVPIPFNSLGSPMKEAFLGAAGDNWGQLVRAYMLSIAQIERFHREYSIRMKNARHSLEHNHTNSPRRVSLQEFDFQDKESLKTLYHQLCDYQGNILKHYKRIWAQFNIAYMIEGLTILSFGAVALLLRVCVWGQCNLRPSASSRAIKIGAATSIATYLIHIVIFEPEEPRATDALILGATMSSLMLFTCRFHLFGMIQAPTKFQMPTFLDAIAIAFTILLSIGFASNSYTIWEDQIVLTFLATFGIYTISMSYRTWDRRQNILGALLSVSFMALARVVSISRYCREEQLPFCVTTYHRLGNAMSWELLIPYVTVILIPLVTQIAFGSDLISRNLGVWTWCHIGIPIALFFNAVYWTLDSANRNGWLEGSPFNMLSKGPRIFFSQATLVTTIAGSGMALITERTTTMTPVRYNMIITTSILVISILVSGPMGGGSLSILYFQILSLRKLLNHSQNGSIGPTIAALLGTLHFFGTGHNATLSSIQWEAAYILSQDLHYPWSSLLVTLNTFAGPIVAAFSIPLIISRDVQPQEVHSVTNSFAIHILIYSVWALSTAIWASVLRRHLMLFAIFCPRFLMAGALLLIIDVIAIIISLITAVNTK